jgi:hypothetical protein
MQLRTGKTTGVRATVNAPVAANVSAPVTESYKLYISELKAMVFELPHWSESPSARIAGFLDIFSYIDIKCIEYKNNPNLQKLHLAMQQAAKNLMYDMANLEKTDPYTITLMQELAPLLISVIAKLK